MIVHGTLPLLREEYPEKYKLLETEALPYIMEYQVFHKAKEIGVSFTLKDFTLDQINMYHLIKCVFEEEYIKKSRK